MHLFRRLHVYLPLFCPFYTSYKWESNIFVICGWSVGCPCASFWRVSFHHWIVFTFRLTARAWIRGFISDFSAQFHWFRPSPSPTPCSDCCCFVGSCDTERCRYSLSAFEECFLAFSVPFNFTCLLVLACPSLWGNGTRFWQGFYWITCNIRCHLK